MLILLWLVPPALVTVVAALVVGYLGRMTARQVDRRVDRDRALQRLGKALADGRPAVRAAGARREQEHSTGIAVRRKAS